jgi:HD-like signal output (HDOD) protein/GGDEF domain-containing protein
VVLDSLVTRAGQLYSLPRVAVEVLDLTSQPQVDVRRLKQVIETDPALTARLLRVVNSSLYGLSREVGDLNQALALLGTKPLKLLVLGFSLPDAMFVGAPGDLLERFWQHTLTRAVAAREISHRFCQISGDEPFIAGLLRDLGQLVLARELGATYIEFWRHVAEHGGSLAALERQALGFDHTQLTARLLEHWKMPAALVEAVAAPDALPASTPLAPRARGLRHILHLAELSAWLLAARRLGTLPELLEAAQAWLGLSRQDLAAFLATLHEKVGQLAELMSLKIGTDYAEVARQAHARLVEVAADAAAELVRRSLDTSPEALESPAVWALSETVANYARWHVSATDRAAAVAPAEARDTVPFAKEPTAPAAVATTERQGDEASRKAKPAFGDRRRQVTPPRSASAAKRPADGAEALTEAKEPAIASTSHAPAVPPPSVASAGSGVVRSGDTVPREATHKIMPRRKPDRPAEKPELPAAPARDEWPGLAGSVATAAATCRSARVSLSLLCLELTGYAELIFAVGPRRAERVLQAMAEACDGVEHDGARRLQTAETRFVLVLPDCGRRQAVQLGDALIAALRRTIGALAGDASATVNLSAGAATVSLPPKNFSAEELIDRAGRCLYAARAAGGDCLKSIEIL